MLFVAAQNEVKPPIITGGMELKCIPLLAVIRYGEQNCKI
jgi:hypothetical protein